MTIKPSTAKGGADGVYMSIEAYEEREKMLAHRASILAAEAAQLVGAPMLTQEALDAKVEALLDGNTQAGISASSGSSKRQDRLP